MQNEEIKPYRSSWMDYLVFWIEGLPGPNWVFYFIVFLFVCVLNNMVSWVTGEMEWGMVDLMYTFGAVYIIYSLGFYHYLKRIASGALHEFFPAMEENISEERKREYRMTNLPAWLGWFGLIIGTVMGFFDAYSSQKLGHGGPGDLFIYTGILSAIGYGSFIALAFQTARQLYIIIGLHRHVQAIDLFNLRPLRAFSRLTATAGFATLLLGAISALIYADSSDPSLVAFYIGMVMLGVLIFVVPLISLQTQINKEKKQQITDSNQRIKHLLAQIHAHVAKDDLAKMGELGTTLGVLEKENAILKGISSYPWNPGVFKSFISTILLPLLLWGIKSLLERWF